MKRNKLTFNQIRNMFFETYPQFKAERKKKKGNNYSSTCGSCFVDFIDELNREGKITENQRSRITLI